MNAVGPENDDHIVYAASVCSPFVLAWGVHGAHLSRDRRVVANLRASGYPSFKALGVTVHGHPKHPLYRPIKAELVSISPFLTHNDHS